MSNKLVQLMGDEFEVWSFPKDTTPEQIKEWYSEYDLYDHSQSSFSQYMKAQHSDIDCHKVVLEEVWVNSSNYKI